MSQQPETTEAKLRRQIAETEAKLDALKLRLAKVEAKGKRVVVDDTGIEQLWKAALNNSRTRSSKHQCRTQWKRIPAAERPTIEEAIAALKAWNKSEEWTRDACMYAPGLHRFIERRMWEDVPKAPDPMDRYKTLPKPAREPATPEEELSPEQLAEEMQKLRASLSGRRPSP